MNINPPVSYKMMPRYYLPCGSVDAVVLMGIMIGIKRFFPKISSVAEKVIEKVVDDLYYHSEGKNINTKNNDFPEEIEKRFF